MRHERKRRRTFYAGALPLRRCRAYPGIYRFAANPEGGHRKQKERPPHMERPLRLGPVPALGSRPRVALSSGRENEFYTEQREIQGIDLTRKSLSATLG